MKSAPRLVYLVIFLVCTGLIGFALYLQHSLGLEPCPMCILQRYAFVAVGVIALAAAIQDPAPLRSSNFSGLVLGASCQSVFRKAVRCCTAASARTAEFRAR